MTIYRNCFRPCDLISGCKERATQTEWPSLMENLPRIRYRGGAHNATLGSQSASLIQVNKCLGVQAATLFLIAPMIAVSMAPPAPPAISCETTPPTLRCPATAAATTDGSANVTI